MVRVITDSLFLIVSRQRSNIQNHYAHHTKTCTHFFFLFFSPSFVFFDTYTHVGDSILPMLGITHDELKFQLYSKDYGVEKPDARFFDQIMKNAEVELFSDGNISQDDDPLLPFQILHVGNDYAKDFEGARRAGMHAVLLDRYDEKELSDEWRRRGAIVLTDLMDLCEFLGASHCKLG